MQGMRYVYPASLKGNNIMYHKSSFEAGRRTRAVIITLLQGVVSLAVAYIMYCGIWVIHYGK